MYFRVVSFLIIFLVFLIFNIKSALAFTAIELQRQAVGIDVVDNNINLGNRDPRTMVAQIINTTMMFLGIIAVVIMLVGGFKWMTAMGNEKGVEEAKKLMGAGVIGLVIILASWGIATFVLQQLINATQ
jgi:TRAP-type C4-dicarboxylate transport system permease small subunit